MRLAALRRVNPFVVATAGRAGVQVCTLLAMLMAIAVVDVPTFGAFSVAWVVTVIAVTLQYSGLYEQLLRSRAVDDERDTVFWLLAAQGLAFALAMLAAAAAMGPALRMGFCALAAIPLVAAASAWYDALLVREGRVATVGLAILAAELGSVAVLALALAHGERGAALIAWRLSAAVFALACLAAAARHVPRPRFSRSVARQALQAAWPLQGTTFVQTLSTYAADLLLAWHLNPAAAGAYRAASRMSVTGADVFFQPLRPMTWSALARHERNDDVEAMRGAYIAQLRILTFLAWPTLVGLSLFSARIFEVLAREDWSGAAGVMVVLALARLPAAFDFFLEPVLVCRGRPRLQFWARLGFTLSMLAGLLVAARQGAVAVALWQLAAATALGLGATVLVCRTLPIAPQRVIAAAVPGLLMALVCAAAGELAFRVIAVPEPYRLGAAAAVMAACLLAGGLWLRQRGRIALPG